MEDFTKWPLPGHFLIACSGVSSTAFQGSDFAAESYHPSQKTHFKDNFDIHHPLGLVVEPDEKGPFVCAI